MSILQRISAGSLDRRRPSERRKARRRPAKGAAVAIEKDGGFEAALCSDVSPGGLRLSIDRPLSVGEAVKVSFGPDFVLSGRVAWVENADCGIEFDQAVGGAQGDSCNLPATERRSAMLPAIRDPQSRFREGLSVTVVLPDYERKAIIRWTDDNFASFTLKP